MALNDYCIGLESELQPDGRLVFVTPDGMASRRVAIRNGRTNREVVIQWPLLSAAQFLLLKAEFDAIGYAGAADLTPPVGPAGKYRFTSFEFTVTGPDEVSVGATLELVE